ncbi:MAG: hypothetical protein ACRDJJ_01150 [Actinomycetota bacterium]
MRFWRDRLKADYLAGTYAPAQLQKSRELAAMFSQHCRDASTLHELGVGAGRNILYLYRERPDVGYSGNDLDRRACFAAMHPEVRQFLQFTERDTLTLLRERVEQGQSVDCVLVADHLIHIPPDSIDEVLALMTRFARRYILFHEGVTRRPDRTDDFWFAHQFERLRRDFDLPIDRDDSPIRSGEYALRLYTRKRSV